MICIKFDQKIKKKPKNLNFGLLRFFLVFLNLGFFEAIFQPCLSCLYSVVCTLWVQSRSVRSNSLLPRDAL